MRFLDAEFVKGFIRMANDGCYQYDKDAGR